MHAQQTCNFPKSLNFHLDLAATQHLTIYRPLPE